MDCVRIQRPTSSRNGNTTRKKGRENIQLEARNRKSNRTEENIVHMCSEMRLSDSDSDEEKSQRKSVVAKLRGKRNKGVKKSKSRSTKQLQPTCILIDKDVYIKIPLSVISGNQFSSCEDKSPSSNVEGQCFKINYKLIEGFPSCADIRKRKSYVMSYNRVTKNADWVYEILNESTLEERCKEHMSFGKNEFKNKNYQQGHLAAAANHRWCQEVYHDTCLLTNMIPQLSKANQGIWKTLEEYCRDLAEPGCNVHDIGPLYLCKKNGKYAHDPKPKNQKNSEEKAVPSHLFKVIIVETEGSVEEPECYVIPNEESEYKKRTKSATNYPPEKDLEEFQEKIGKIEKWSGLKFKIDNPPHNTRHTETIIWKGEDKKGELCEAKIEVKIQI